jgi:alpha-glucosidase
VLGNHDNARIATRVGIHQVRLAAMLLLSLPGTITLYYGEEIGMTNVPIPPHLVQDPAEKNEPGIGVGRDPERTPMPWDSSPLAGFTTGRPWLPLGEDHASLNVEKSDQDPESILNLYRTLIALRKSHPVLVTGELHSVAAANSVLTYERHGCGERLRIILNLGDAPATIPSEVSEILAATSPGCTSERPNKLIQLGAAMGLIIRLHT